MTNPIESFEGIAAKVVDFEFANEEIVSAVISYRRKSDNVLVVGVYDGEKFVKAGYTDRLRVIGFADDDMATHEQICIKMGIAYYPVDGHCHEAQMLAKYGPEIAGKYFATFEVGSVADKCYNHDSPMFSEFICEDDLAWKYMEIFNDMTLKQYI